MKKNLLLSLCMLGLLASCQKEHQKTTTVNSPAFVARHLSLAPAYTDMTLNSDGSYTALWNDCLIKVTSPAWDQVKYPTLANGVPVLAGSLITYDGTSSVDVANSGSDGNVFQVTQRYGLLSEFNSDAFNSDLGTYWTTLDTWIGAGQHGTAPVIATYVKDSYTITVGTDQVKTYTGKLIRVTTGSHLAIADMSYSLPAAQTVPTNQLAFNITDPTTGQGYTVKGSHDVLTTATFINTTTAVVISGTYTIDSAGNITAIGTIIRSNGTTFNFNKFMEI